MEEKKHDVKINIDQIPVEGALGLLALGDVGVKLWREAVRKKMIEQKSQKKQNEQKKG